MSQKKVQIQLDQDEARALYNCCCMASCLVTSSEEVYFVRRVTCLVGAAPSINGVIQLELSLADANILRNCCRESQSERIFDRTMIKRLIDIIDSGINQTSENQFDFEDSLNLDDVRTFNQLKDAIIERTGLLVRSSIWTKAGTRCRIELGHNVTLFVFTLAATTSHSSDWRIVSFDCADCIKNLIRRT